MRSWILSLVVPALAALAIGAPAAADRESVPLYTGEDLDRMFGPVPAGPSIPTDKTRPEDWRWVEQFLDREYARIDADRRHDLDSRQVDIAAGQFDEPEPFYGGSLLWGTGYPYPASRWNVAGPGRGYGRRDGAAACNGSRGLEIRAAGTTRGGVSARGMARANGHSQGRAPRR